jgi:hypothetical protein
MKRRTFLITGAAGVLAVVGGRLIASSDESAIVKVIYKRLDYLKLDGPGVRQFATELAALGKSSLYSISSTRLRLIDAAGPLYTGIALTAGANLADALSHGEDRVVTHYLMSSDFFRNGADVSRTVHYLGQYDPLVACNNPFARPAVAGTAT